MFEFKEPNDRRTFVYLFTIITLAIVLKQLPYILNGFHFEIGFDTGTYQMLLREFLNADQWTVLPGSPDFIYTSMTGNDPAFFVISSWFVILGEVDLNLLFRWVWPIIMTISFQVIVYIAAKGLTDSRNFGLLASFFLAVSHVQINTFMESFWKQILASFLLIMGLVFLYQFVEKHCWRQLILALIFFFGTMVYHSAFIPILAFFFLLILLYYTYSRQYKVLTYILPFLFIGVLVVALIIINFPQLIEGKIDSFIIHSLEGLKTFYLGGANHAGGGGISGLLGGSTHVTILYTLFFPATFILALFSFKHNLNHKISVFHLLFIVLLLYCILWLYFANRFVIDLDILVCILASLGAFFLLKKYISSDLKNAERRRIQAFVVGLMVLFSVSMVITGKTILETEPYITDEQFIEWYVTNLPVESSAIVGNERISTMMQQKGYSVGLFSTSTVYYKYFLLLAPNDYAMAQNFALNSPFVGEKDLFVIITDYDYQFPLINEIYLSIESYQSSPHFQLLYQGDGQVKFVYKFIIQD